MHVQIGYYFIRFASKKLQCFLIVGVDEHFGDGGISLFSWPCQLHAPHATNFN
jgi:hypothetical protein